MAEQHYPDPAGDIEGDFDALIQELRMEIGAQGPTDSEPTRVLPVVEAEEPRDSFDEYFDSAFGEMESEMNPQPESEPEPEPQPEPLSISLNVSPDMSLPEQQRKAY